MYKADVNYLGTYFQKYFNQNYVRMDQKSYISNLIKNLYCGFLLGSLRVQCSECPYDQIRIFICYLPK